MRQQPATSWVFDESMRAGHFRAHTRPFWMRVCNSWINKTHIIIERLQRVYIAVEDLESQSRGFLITGEHKFLDRYESDKRELRSNIQAIESLTQDNPQQQQHLVQLNEIADRKIAICDSLIAARPVANSQFQQIKLSLYTIHE